MNNDAEREFSTSEDRGAALGGWLFIEPSLLPDEWQERATLTACVRLFPDEAAAISGRANGVKTPDDPEFLALVADGLSADAIARRVHAAPRSVYRRLARLRTHFGVTTTAELVAELSRRGY
ncbi:MAG: hypothetical protein ACRDLB_14315 [Actinomycetota bacterium]